MNYLRTSSSYNPLGISGAQALQEIEVNIRKIEDLARQVKTESGRGNFSKVVALINDSKNLLSGVVNDEKLAFLYNKKIEALCYLDFKENLNEINELHIELAKLNEKFPLNAKIKAFYWIAMSIVNNRGVKNLSEHNPFFPRLEFGQNENLELLNDCLKGLSEVSADIDDKELEAEVNYHNGLNCLLSPFKRNDAANLFIKAAAAYSKIDNSDRGFSFMHPGEIKSLVLEGLALAFCGNYEASTGNLERALKFIAGNSHLLQSCPYLKVMSLITKMEVLYFFFKNPEMLSFKSEPMTMKMRQIASIQPAEIIQVINEARQTINEICEHLNPQIIDKDTDYSWVFFENDARISFIRQDIEALA